MWTPIYKIFELFFPPFCLSCDERMDREEHLLCKSCYQNLNEFVEPFQLSPFYATCPIWDSVGPSQTLVTHLTQGKPYLVDAIAPFLIYRFYQLEIDPPKAITFIPTKPHLKWSLGFCPRELLAQTLSDLWGIPLQDCLSWENDRLVLKKDPKENRIAVLEMDDEKLLQEAGSELDKRELIAFIVSTSSCGSRKPCPIPKGPLLQS